MTESPIERLIAASSLGTPEATALRALANWGIRASVSNVLPPGVSAVLIGPPADGEDEPLARRAVVVRGEAHRSLTSPDATNANR